MTREIFDKAEKILNRIDEIQNTIDSIKYALEIKKKGVKYALELIEKGQDTDDFFVLFGFDKKKGVKIGQSKEDDDLLIKLLEHKKQDLEKEFETL